MRPDEAFVCVAQIGVRVEMKNAEILVALGVRADRAEWNGVIAAHDELRL